MDKTVTLALSHPVSSTLYDGYRIKHWAETADHPPIDGRPEINVLVESAVYMTEPIQRLCFDLFYSQIKGYLSYEDAKRKWRVLYDYMRAFTNKTGFNGEDVGLAPRWDYVNGLNAGAELPAFDKVRVCSGAFIKGYERDGYLIVQTLNPDSVPDLVWLLEHPQFYFHAVLAYTQAAQNFPQGQRWVGDTGLPVLVPLFSRVEAKIHLSKVERWISNKLPNPYRIYSPL